MIETVIKEETGTVDIQTTSVVFSKKNKHQGDHDPMGNPHRNSEKNEDVTCREKNRIEYYFWGFLKRKKLEVNL